MPLGGGGGGGLNTFTGTKPPPPPPDSVVANALQLFSPHEKNDRFFLNRYADSCLSEKKIYQFVLSSY